MKTTAIIHLTDGTKIKTAESVDSLFQNLNRAGPSTLIGISRLTDSGKKTNVLVAVERLNYIEAL